MDNTGKIHRFTPEQAAEFNGPLVPLEERQAEVLAKLSQADRIAIFPLMRANTKGWRQKSFKKLKNCSA